jgi:hypothetical protein
MCDEHIRASWLGIFGHQDAEFVGTQEYLLGLKAMK